MEYARVLVELKVEDRGVGLVRRRKHLSRLCSEIVLAEIEVAQAAILRQHVAESDTAFVVQAVPCEAQPAE